MQRFVKHFFYTICLVTMSFSQTNSNGITAQGYTFRQCVPLEPFSKWSGQSAALEPNWELIYRFKSEAEKTSDGAIKSIDSCIYLLKEKLEETHKTKIINGDSIGHAMLLRYSSNITDVFNGLKLINNDFGEFIYNAGTCPVNFVSKDDSRLLSSTTILISAIALNTIYNTQEYTAKERAEKVVSHVILPNLGIIAKAFANTMIKYVAIAVIYGSKDFTNDEETLNLLPETVILVTPIKTCNDFSKGTITDEELINASDAYQNSRDMHPIQINKIKISIN